MLPCYKSGTGGLDTPAPLLPSVLLSPQQASRGSEAPSRVTTTSLKNYTRAGNLTVLATDPLLHQDPVQLDFHFRCTPQTSTHWHGLLCDHRLFLDIPYQALDQGNWERREDQQQDVIWSLTATLEYVEEKTNVDLVFVSFQNNRNDRGALLRAFSYMGFEVVRPDHPVLPPWDNVIFMVYPLERELGHLPSEPP
ncbi:ornithine decarboxylase antizyme 3 [Prionailurus iriomotensis]